MNDGNKATCNIWVEYRRGKTTTTRVDDQNGTRYLCEQPMPKERRARSDQSQPGSTASKK